MTSLQGRMILFAAIGGLLAMMGGIVYYASLDNPELEKAEIKLTNVEILEVNTIENRVKLKTTFLVKNASEKTFTVPLITYELFANEKSIGSDQYSTEDIAMPGRAAFYPASEIPLSSIFQLVLTPENADVYKIIVESGDVKFSVIGTLTVETAWSIVEKEFSSSM